MKSKKSIILIPILISTILGSCSFSDMINRFKGTEITDFFLFNINSLDDEPNKSFGFCNEETKEFTSKEEVSNLEDLFIAHIENEENFDTASTFCTCDELDFDKYSVYVTAFYKTHRNADFCVDKIVLRNSEVTQRVNITINSPATPDSDYCFLYVFAPKDIKVTNKIKTKTNYNTNEVYKPVIYLYNDKEMDVTVNYVESYRLLTTYPKYEDGWNVHINEDKTLLINGSKREYYAIFFDEISEYNCNFEYGFNVTKDNAITFLEEKLDFLGYTERESNEFIMFWLPILESNENSLVYFEQTEERNEECPLEFSVQPDTLLRTIIHIKKVNSYTEIKPQTLKRVDRSGFSVVEWGGTTY